MSKRVHTTSEDGFVSTTEAGDETLTIDGGASGEAPDTLETLLAAYAACYVPALRVGAEQRGADPLGAIEIEATGDLNESDKLEAVSFDITVDRDLTQEKAEDVIQRANQLCKVHDALKDSLNASVTINGITVNEAASVS